jgi:ABC-type sugar transport system ATPase subunit
MESSNLLRLTGISKSFPGVRALDDVQFELNKGEIVGLVGENGAGKSTMMKIINGMYYPDSGEIFINNEKVVIHSPKDAMHKYKIGYISQKELTYHDLTVAENIYIGDWKAWGRSFLSWKKVKTKAKELMDSLMQENVDVRSKLSALSPGERQMIEVAAAIHRKNNILIMDEPTSSLTLKEKETLFKLMANLREKGIGIIFITHFLDEIFGICDRVFIMKDGKNVWSGLMKDISKSQMIEKITGRKTLDIYKKEKTSKFEKIILEVEKLSTEMLHEVSFRVRRGEVLGITGLVGSGKTELVRAMYGLDPIQSGTIRVNGKPVKAKSPKKVKNLGIGFLSEDKDGEGIVPKMSVAKNITLSSLKKISVMGSVLNIKRENEIAGKYVSALNINTPSLNTEIAQLSGGNQQKSIIGRWLASDSELFFFDEATKGIDVGAKNEIYNLVLKLSEEGKTVVYVSSELKEILILCDRYIILREGRLLCERERGFYQKENELLAEMSQ